MRTRRTLAAGVLLLTVLAFGRHATADSGTHTDPRDSSGRLDIARIGHTNSDTTVTYRLEMYDELDIEDVDLVTWDFDLNNDGKPADACILLQRIGTSSTLRGAFYAECGPETWDTQDASVSGNVLEITFPLLDLVEGAGLRPGDAYSYRVTARDHDGVEDSAPEDALVRHEDVPAIEPRRGAADTQLGFPGDARSNDGATLPGRSQTTGGTAEEGDGIGEDPVASSERALGPLGAIPIIGNLCSGASCFAIGIGVPVAAALVGYAVLIVVRRRRREASIDGDGHDPLVDLGARSHPGNL